MEETGESVTDYMKYFSFDVDFDLIEVYDC